MSRVDWNNQVLVVLSIGRRETATGIVQITDVSYNAMLHSWSVSGRVGVNVETCTHQPAASYPFALAAAPRPPDKLSTGYGTSNFPDGCKQPVIGEPTAIRSASGAPDD